VAALLLALSAIFVLAGGTLDLQFWVNGDDAPDSTPVKFVALAPGDCISEEWFRDESIDPVPVVSCTEPHIGEVIAIADYAIPTAQSNSRGGVVMGTHQLWVEQNCWPAFATYVGIPFKQSVYNVGAAAFTPETLRSSGATRNVCMVSNMDRSPLNYSVKGIAK
jgi:hypothetical protein